ncbi:MAG: RNA pseudouridine synthase [Desulfobacteraceae bacterium]|nr:RNA pseudouridine synthase [Desulfobacteraceae bacterium]
MMLKNYQQSPLPVLSAGKGYLVVDKPAGMAVHNRPGADVCSMMKDFILSHSRIRQKAAFSEEFGIHALNRLDKTTSGLLLLTCTPEAHRHLANQLTQGRIRKEYIAIVHGALYPALRQEWLQWNLPLTKTAAGRSNPQGKGKRVACDTRLRILHHSRRYTMIQCNLITGRTHQIRRHAALDGHSILGDQRYGSKRSCRYLAEHHSFKRLALHASSLTLTFAGTSGCQRIESALPLSMRQLFEHDLESKP